MTSTDKYGFERIAKVEIQRWEDPEYATVWIITKAGDVFSRETLIGETEEDNAAYYEKRGTTDSQCTFFASKADVAAAKCAR